MNKCHIYFDNESNTFLCKLFNDDVNEVFAANAVLPELNKVKFNKLTMVNNQLNLKNDNLSVTIYDLDKFVELGLYKKIPLIVVKIIKKVAETQIKNISNKAKTVVLKNKKTAVCSALVALMLAVGVGTVNANDNEPIPIETQTDSNDEKEKEDDSERIAPSKSLVEENTDDQVVEVNEEENESVTINYDDLTDSEKYMYAKDIYFDLIENYSNKWGVDVELMMAILTQESGGKITNLMQIEFDACADEVIEVYNFRDNRYQKFILSDNPNLKSNEEITVITRDDLKNPKTNISVGCILLRKSLERMNYHVAAGICCYNQGIGNMNKIFRETYACTGMDKDEILADQTNISFMDYTYASGQGDPEYLLHVLPYMENPDVIIKVLNDDNEVEEYTINIVSNETVRR